MVGGARGPDRKLLGAYRTPDALVAHALALLPPPPAGAHVVDLSCGDGAWLTAASARWPQIRLSGAEIDPSLVRALEPRLPEASLRVGDGRTLPLGEADLVLGNPPWGAGRTGRVRRGVESASEFIDRALAILKPGGRLCQILPAAWLEVAAHRAARARLLEAAAIERIELLGHAFPGVFSPAALVIARREPDASARREAIVQTPAGPVPQAQLEAAGHLRPALDGPQRQLLARLDAHGETLAGRATFILGVVTGDNRAALRPVGGEGEPIVRGREVAPYALAEPALRLVIPLARAQQAAPLSSYRRRKVIYRFIAPYPVAAVDDVGRLTLNSANGIALDDPALPPAFVAACLNSAPLRFAHRSRTGLVRVLRSHLERLPLPKAPPAERRRIVRLVEERGAAAAEELDELVCDLFRLSPHERAQCRAS